MCEKQSNILSKLRNKHKLTDKIASYNQSLSKQKLNPLLQARKHKGKKGKSPRQEYLPSLFPLLRLSSLKYQKSEEVELPEIIICGYNAQMHNIVLSFTCFKTCANKKSVCKETSEYYCSDYRQMNEIE